MVGTDIEARVAPGRDDSPRSGECDVEATGWGGAIVKPPKFRARASAATRKLES